MFIHPNLGSLVKRASRTHPIQTVRFPNPAICFHQQLLDIPCLCVSVCVCIKEMAGKQKEIERKGERRGRERKSREEKRMGEEEKERVGEGERRGKGRGEEKGRQKDGEGVKEGRKRRGR